MEQIRFLLGHGRAHSIRASVPSVSMKPKHKGSREHICRF
jgi:hypothetical protein